MDIKRIIKLLIAMSVILLFGTVGYTIIEGWPLFDSFYMTFITISTVGFSETHNLSTLGRAFTLLIISFGIGLVAFIGSEFAKVLLSKQFEIIFGRRKMVKELSNLQDHYIICGFGRMGSAAASYLEECKIKFCIIEKDEDRVKLAFSKEYPTCLGDPSNDSILSMARIEKAKGILIILPNDNDNLLITLAARELNPNIHILTRCDQEEIKQRVKTAGANKIVNPLRMGGEQIAQLVAQL